VANEPTIPRLPCGSIDAIADFYRVLGCRKALPSAVVLADSRGDHRQAARILDSALARPDAADHPIVQVEALVYRAEVAMVLHDPETARHKLTRAEGIDLAPDARRRLAGTLAAAVELSATAR
jgi:hypothetical protein